MFRECGKAAGMRPGVHDEGKVKRRIRVPVSPRREYHRNVLSEYLRAAMLRAVFEVIEDDGSFYGRIPGLEGVWANAPKLKDCRTELEQVLEEWLLLRLSERLSIPEIDGIDLTVQREVA